MTWWFWIGYMGALILYGTWRKRRGKPFGYYRWDKPLVYGLTGVLALLSVITVVWGAR